MLMMHKGKLAACLVLAENASGGISKFALAAVFIQRYCTSEQKLDCPQSQPKEPKLCCLTES